MQDDDAANPGMLSVLDGEALWNRADGASGKSCARCHGDATSSMRGVATRYPAVDAVHRRPIDLEQRVNVCRVEYQQAPPLAFESKELLALAAYLGHLSKGLPITIADGDETRPFIAAGREDGTNTRCASKSAEIATSPTDTSSISPKDSGGKSPKQSRRSGVSQTPLLVTGKRRNLGLAMSLPHARARRKKLADRPCFPPDGRQQRRARTRPAEITPVCDSLQTIFGATKAQQRGAGAGVAERHTARSS